jgi:hypothetical protein
VPSERCSTEEQSIEYCGWTCVFSDVVRGDLRSVTVTYPHLYCLHVMRRARGVAVVDVPRYKPEGRGIDSRWCH